MRLVELTTFAFRNLVDATLPLAPGTTVLLGDNGQGKTNVLEAIGVLATTKSFRRAKPAELARHATADDTPSRGPTWRVAGPVASDVAATGSADIDVDVAWVDGRRSLRVNRVPVDLAGHVGLLTVVPVTQASAGIARGGPQERRDFLDRGILGARPAYLRLLSRHRRALQQKAALLRAGQRTDPDELDAWNERLARDGAELTTWRRAHVAELASRLAEIGPTFLPRGEQLDLRLEDVIARAGIDAAAADRETVVAALRERFDAARTRELASGKPLVGPQRDDLRVTLGGRDLRRFASSGQQRNAVLALLLAEVEVFRARRGETPVLLVDDVDTEIDRTRLGRFLEHAGGRCQSVLTSSKRDLFGRPPPDSLFYAVRGGLVEALA